jgi:hypothetical protein
MSINYISHKELFNLKDNYTKEDLKKSFLNKIYNVDKLNISNTEKKILIQNYYTQYKKAKANLFNQNNPNKNQMFITFNPIGIFNNIEKQHKTFFNEFDNIFNIVGNSTLNPNTKHFSTSYIQQKKINPDGTTSVIESSSKNINGQINKKTDSYKIDKNGNKIPKQKQIKN